MGRFVGSTPLDWITQFGGACRTNPQTALHAVFAHGCYETRAVSASLILSGEKLVSEPQATTTVLAPRNIDSKENHGEVLLPWSSSDPSYWQVLGDEARNKVMMDFIEVDSEKAKQGQYEYKVRLPDRAHGDPKALAAGGKKIKLNVNLRGYEFGVASANLVPVLYIGLDPDYERARCAYTVIHELAHALGFAPIKGESFYSVSGRHCANGIKSDAEAYVRENQGTVGATVAETLSRGVTGRNVPLELAASGKFGTCVMWGHTHRQKTTEDLFSAALQFLQRLRPADPRDAYRFDNRRRNVSAAALELSEEVLRAGSALDDALARLIDEGRAGIALCAPANVRTSVLTRGSGGLPLAGCCVETLREASRRPPFESMAVLVAAQLETGRVRAGRAFPDPTQGSLAPPPADPGEGFTGSVFRLDVASRLGIPPVPGPIAVWLIARDRAAGPVHIVVENPPPPGIEDEEVAKFLTAWRKRNIVKPHGADPATVWPEETVFGSYPVYRKSAESPAMPNKGIELSAKRAVVLEKGAAWVLAGSFRLTIPRRHVVLEPLSGDPTTAVVPITLVITSNEIAGPIVRHLRVPSYSPVNPGDPTPIVEGQFKLNLFSFSGMWRTPRSYVVYAVCGDTISNPAVTALGLCT